MRKAPQPPLGQTIYGAAPQFGQNPPPHVQEQPDPKSKTSPQTGAGGDVQSNRKSSS